MASGAKKPPGDGGTPAPMRPARLRVMRPEVEEVLRSPRRGRPKLKDGGGEGPAEDADADGGAAPPRYDCAFQDEKGEFAPPEMVWCKVRSHSWWPAQVFDAADASELALQHARSGGGAPLVTNFWDNTFTWSEPSALLPFRANFRGLAGKSTLSSYVSAVDAALGEVGRRVEAGLSCACVPNARKRQEVRNSGVREGAYGAVVDDVYMRDTFHGETFLEYISALARNPLSGADRLDLATAKAQLRSFNRLRGPRELPEFVIYGGIEDVPTEATPQTKRKRVEKDNNVDDVLSKEKKQRHDESSLRKRGAAKEEADDEEGSVPRKSSARKKTSKDVDKTESHAIKKDAVVEDSSKRSKSKISKSPAEKKKKDSSKGADKKESLPEPTVEDATDEDSSMPSGEAKDGTLSKGGKSKISKSSPKAKKKDISKDAAKKKSLPDPAKEEATGDDSSTLRAADGTLSKERKSNISKSPAKKKQDASKDTDGVKTVGGSETPVKKTVDGTLSESKSALRLRSTHKTEDASECSNGPRKDDVGKPTKRKDKDAALLKENNLGRRASSALQKDKTTADEDGLADGSVKDPVSPGKKKSQPGKTLVTKDVPISISEHGRKRKKLSELLVETGTPNRSPAGKSKARGKRSLPASTEKLDRDTEDTVKTRGRRSLLAHTEKPEETVCDTDDTKKTRGKRSMPALTEKPEDPDRDTKDKTKTREERSLPESTEDPDRDTKDPMKTRKRKKLDTLGDLSSQPPLSPKEFTKGRAATPKAAGKKSQASPVVKANGDTLGDSSSQPQPLSPKRSTKTRESTRKAAELKPHTSPAVKANDEASQTRLRRTKNSEETVPDKSPQSVELNKGKKGASTEDSLSCDEMHSQLFLAASDLKKVGKITPTSVSFFTKFSKSSCPASSDVEKEIPTEADVEKEIPTEADVEKEIPVEADVEKEIPIEAVIADSYASSPHADEEIPEEAAKKVASPHATEETPEKATNKVASPPADEEVPEKPTDNEPSPDKEVPEKPTDNEPRPSEPPVADHMKDDYWADILINVEEPISSLKKKKDKSNSKTSKTKELQAEAAATKALPVSVGNVEVEEPTAAEAKQDNTENRKAVANGAQEASDEETENPLTGLVLHFNRPDAVPLHSDLVKVFSQYGSLSEVRTQTGNNTNSATLIFKQRYAAEGAFGSARNMTGVLGPGLISFRLSDFPGGGSAAASSGNMPR